MMTSFDDIDIETAEVSLDDLAELLSAIANKSRLLLIESLLEGPNEFSELKEIVKLSKTALAHHLEKLVSFDILVNTSRGKYELSEDGKTLFLALKEVYLKSQVKKRFVFSRLRQGRGPSITRKDNFSYTVVIRYFDNFRIIREIQIILDRFKV